MTSTIKLIMDTIASQITDNITLIDDAIWGEQTIMNEDVNIWSQIEVTEVLQPLDPNVQGVNTEINEDWVVSCIEVGNDHNQVCEVVESLQLLWQKQDNSLFNELKTLLPNGNQIINMTWGTKVYPSNIKGNMGYEGLVQFKLEVRLFFPT